MAGALLAAACGGIPAVTERPVEEPVEHGRYGLVALAARAATPDREAHLEADAFFWHAENGQNDGCEVVDTVDACSISLCVPPAAAANALEDSTWLSAGRVDVLGTKIEFSFAPSSDGAYADTLPNKDMSLWDGGEALTAVAAGSRQFPSLEVTTVAPERVTLTAPELADGAPGIDPDVGVGFAWSSPQDERVYVDLEADRALDPGLPTSTRVRCSFSAGEGEGFVPPAVFAAFKVPSTIVGYKFRVSTETRAENATDDVDFTFLVSTESARFEMPVVHPHAGESD